MMKLQLPASLSDANKNYVLETLVEDLLTRTPGLLDEPRFKAFLAASAQRVFEYPYALTSHVLYQNDPKKFTVLDQRGVQQVLKGCFLDLNKLPEFIDQATGTKKVEQLFLMFGRKPTDPVAGTRPQFTPYMTILVLGIKADGTFLKDPATNEPISYEYLTPCSKDDSEEVEAHFPTPL